MVRNIEWHAANGDVLYFNETPPFLLTRFYPGNPSGAAEIARGIRTDGQQTFHVSAEPLTPSLTGSMHAAGVTIADKQEALDKLRIRLQAALNPKHFGTLVFNNYAGSFKLRCRPITGAEFANRFANTHRLDIEWISDDAYWTVAESKSLTIGIVKKMWRFPWVIKPTVFGAIFNKGFISNPTEIDIFPKIVVTETSSSRVTIGNRATGQYTTIAHSISTGQTLELDMSVPSAILINEDGTREDVTFWTTVESDFPWAIVPGDNEVYSTTDNPELSPIITIMWDVPEVGI